MIIYRCADLLFSTKVKSTADALGVPARPVRNPEMLQKRLDRVDDGKANGPVSGALIGLDDENQGQEAAALIRQIKAFDPSIPVVAFAGHVETQALRAGAEAGADRVMTNGQFTQSLPALLQELDG